MNLCIKGSGQTVQEGNVSATDTTRAVCPECGREVSTVYSPRQRKGQKVNRWFMVVHTMPKAQEAVVSEAG